MVAIDTYFSSQEGYLAQPPGYEGIGYMQFARTAYLLLRHLHLKTALAELNSIAPLWTFLQTVQYFIVGDGTWQAFTVRFWPVALLLTLVYWIVRARATRTLAVAAVAFTALLPLVSAGVRSSSLEFLSGQANFGEDWYLDDLRPDFLAIVFVLWSVAPLAEHHRRPRRSTYLVSAAFAAAAVLAKPSTSPIALAAWVAALGLAWYWHRREPGTLRLTALAAGFVTVLLFPWAVLGGGLVATVSRLHEGAVTYGAAYGTSLNLFEGLTYYLVRVPNQLGQIEAVAVTIGLLFTATALLRRRLDRPEWMYAGLVVLFYLALSIPSNKSSGVGLWISLSLWIFFVAGASRLAAARWSLQITRASPVVLAAAGAYVLLAYSLGAFALAGWPANEQRSNAQLVAVTTDIAHELGRHLSVDDCFTYAPGPGWPASIEYLLMDSNGSAPGNTAIDVDPTVTTTSAYVDAAKRCAAVIVYREDISQVARIFFAPPVRLPYLRAVAEWVRSPASGYALDRSWPLSDLAPGRDDRPSGPHPLGRYQGVSLTVDLYFRV